MKIINNIYEIVRHKNKYLQIHQANASLSESEVH